MITKKAVQIKNIRQAASGNLAGAPGNLLINVTGEAKPENWFSSREWRNFLIGSGLNPNIPVILFQGATIKFEELVVTREMINQPSTKDPNIMCYKHTMNGREVEYRQEGKHNINLEIDLRSLGTETVWSMAELALKYPRTRQVLSSVAPASTAPTEEQTTVDMPENTETVPAASNVEDLVDSTDAATAQAQTGG